MKGTVKLPFLTGNRQSFSVGLRNQNYLAEILNNGSSLFEFVLSGGSHT